MTDFIHPKIVLQKANVRPRKRWGQNFLCSPQVIEKIVDCVPTKAQVVEIGPGVGAITRELLKRNYAVTAVEIDPLLVKIMKSEFENVANFKIIEADFLTISLSDLIIVSNDMPLVVVGNLPYYIVSQIIFRLLESTIPIQRVVTTIQKEVGQRLIAKPGTSDYSILTILTQYRADVKVQARMNPGVFYPAPNVESMIITLDFSEPKVSVPDEILFFEVIRSAFSQRRKMLRNTLKRLNLAAGLLQQAFKDCEIDSRRRGETLSLTEFAELTRAIYNQKSLIRNSQSTRHVLETRG